jgi:hypothetical protein
MLADGKSAVFLTDTTIDCNRFSQSIVILPHLWQLRHMKTGPRQSLMDAWRGFGFYE